MGIVIKGVTVPALMIKLDKNKNVEENIAELEDKLSSAFFKGSMAVIDLSDIGVAEEERRKIQEVLERHDTKFLGYKALDKGEKKEGGSISSLQADSIPLGEAQDRLRQAQDSAQMRRSLDGIKEKKSSEIINKTLRSGQKVEHDGDVFIMGDVNPNSYVIASGNIIVMGTLRGIVHAGASGDETAFVMALKLKPQQLRIGSFFTRAPDNIEDPEYPEKAFVKDNQIYIEKIQT